MARTDYFPRMELAPPGPEMLLLAHRQHRRRRWGVFLLLWVLLTGAALGHVWSRTPRYEVEALLALPAGQGADLALVDLALQRQQLLTGELLGAVLDGLPDDSASIAELRRILSVEPVGGSMLMLRAVGADAGALVRLVNRWLDEYTARQSEQRQRTTVRDDQWLNDELATLEADLQARRQALAAFRAEHDIVSLERQENTAAARLQGLTEAVNEANQAAVAAGAELAAVRERLARGQSPGTDQQDPGLRDLEREVADLQARLRDLERRFTPAYMRLDPDVVALTETLKSLEQQLIRRRRAVAEQALAEARQAADSARNRVQTLEAQLAEFRDTASRFAGHFDEYQTMMAALERQEERYRALQERQAEAQSSTRQQLPAVQVVDRARLPDRPVWPDYRRDSLLAVGGGLLLALLGVLIFDFLNRPPPASPAYPPAWQSLPMGYAPAARGLPAAGPEPGLSGPAPAPALPASPLELTPEAVATLLEVADAETRTLIGLALSGLPLEALVMLDRAELDPAQGVVWMGGETVPLAPLLRGWLAALGDDAEGPLWRDRRGFPRSREELEALLRTCAHDAGLDAASRVDLAALRHTYLAFLARQGVRLGELARLAGLAPGEVERYRPLAPPGRGRALAEVARVYPALG